MRVRRSGLGVQVVPVVPDRDQAEVGDRGEGGGPGAGDDPYRAAADGQPAPVALGRPEVGGQRDVPARAEHRAERGVQAVEVGPVRDDEERAPAAGQRRGGRLGEPGRPVLAGQRGPDRVRRAAGAERAQERRTGRVRVPAGRRGRLRRRRGLAGRLGLDPGVPRRQRQPEHVDHRPRPAVGDRPGQPGHLGGQHRLGGHRPLDEGQPAVVLGGRDPLQDDRVDQLAGEPDPDPGAGGDGVVQRARHRVVERAVQVGERDVDHDPGDRVPLGGHPLLGSPPPAGGRRPRPAGRARRGHRSGLPESSDTPPPPSPSRATRFLPAPDRPPLCRDYVSAPPRDADPPLLHLASTRRPHLLRLTSPASQTQSLLHPATQTRLCSTRDADPLCSAGWCRDAAKSGRGVCPEGRAAGGTVGARASGGADRRMLEAVT